MKRAAKAVVSGICLATIVYYTWRWYAGARRIRNLALRTENINYSSHSAEELASEHLADLNSASSDQILAFGMSGEAVQRLLDHRPYRNKLELLSRMVLSPDEYAAIKDKVSVSNGREAVKIA
jgi:hypothetical protein